MKSLLLLLIILVQGSFGYRVVCVYTNWSQYRPDGGKFLPEDVDASLCTHLIYVYAKLKGNKLEPTEWNDEGSAWSEGMYGRVNNLKQLNPELKTLLGVGGWMMGSKDFSKLAAGRIARRIFAKTTAKFLRDRNFDGLTIDWQHPTKRGGKPKDKTNFSLLLQEIRKAFEAESRKSGLPRLLLTTGVSASRNIIEDGYEIDNITKYTDFINVMAYDLHGAWDNYTGHPSQLYAREEEFGPSTEINVDASMRYWMSNVPDRSKLILGVSTYGRTFTLRKARHNDYNVPTTGPGVAGEFTQQPGMLAYYERCSQYADARRVWDAPSQAAYWYSGNQWIAGEDTESVKAKVNWTRTYDIGGVMIWSLDTDDFADMCLSQEYPILNTVVKVLNDPTFVKSNVSVTRKNIRSGPKSNRVPNDMTKHGLSETKPLEDMKLQTTIDSSKTLNSNMQSITTTTTTTTLPTTTLKIDKPIIKVNLDKNKKHKPAQNVQQKMQEQIPKKKKEQQQSKTQQLSKTKPDTVKTLNNKQRRKVGRRRRIRPRMRRKMILNRRQRNKKRKPGPRQKNGQMMMRKSDKKSAENIKRTIKGNEKSSTNDALPKTITAGKVNTPLRNKHKLPTLGEKTSKTTKHVRVVKDTSDLRRHMILTKDMIVTGKKEISKTQAHPQLNTKPANLSIGKTLKIAKRKKAQPVLIVRQKSKKLQSTVKTAETKPQLHNKRLSHNSTMTTQTKSLSHSKELGNTKVSESVPSKSVQKSLPTANLTGTTSIPKHNQTQKKIKKSMNNKMKWRRRKAPRNGKRQKVRRRRKMSRRSLLADK